MNKNLKYMSACAAVVALLSSGSISAQDKAQSDSKSEKKESDRNVMLNASDNKGPRDVNIGLPASVGGTTILSNGLPVVYFFWPELPTKAWRSDATINRAQLLDLGQTAIAIGDVGFSLSTYDNLGTDSLQGVVNLNSNHFGLLRGDMNISGPVNKKGLKFTAGAYLNYDPGTYRAKGYDRYYADKSQLFKGGLTQDYKLEGLKGSFSVLYKYANMQGISQQYAPFRYQKGGKVKELDGFKMGGDSYMERSGKVRLRDAFTGDVVERDPMKDYGSESHTVDFIWKNQLSNGLNINMISRYHRANTGNFLPIMTGVTSADGSKPMYQYENGDTFMGEEVQNVMILGSKKRPINSFTSTFEVGRKSGNHDWSVGLNQWNYSIDKFATEGVFYAQEVAANPRKLVALDEKTGLPIENGTLDVLEYHNGSENKTALFITDKWKVNDVLDLTAGARIEYQKLNGDYQDAGLELKHLNGPKTAINQGWWNKAFMASAVYKATDKFGLLGEVTYNEQGGHLENYNIGVNPNIKKSKIPGAGFGVFFNHPMFSVVSKATYIERDEYRTTGNFSHPDGNVSEVKRATTSYGIQTLGWTTDVMASPFKNFDIHFLLTIQSPKYKDFAGSVTFDKNNSDGSEAIYHYDYSDKTVTGVSKVLIEIDPSYTWNSLRLWASARYFSKQYMNKPNTLDFEGRWETFAGANYSINKHFDVNVTFVNLLNQRGASGDIPDGDLMTTNEMAANKYGTIMSGKYLRPFTAEFGLKYRF